MPNSFSRIFPIVGLVPACTHAGDFHANFGQTRFEHEVPAGFRPLWQPDCSCFSDWVSCASTLEEPGAGQQRHHCVDQQLILSAQGIAIPSLPTDSCPQEFRHRWLCNTLMAAAERDGGSLAYEEWCNLLNCTGRPCTRHEEPECNATLFRCSAEYFSCSAHATPRSNSTMQEKGRQCACAAGLFACVESDGCISDEISRQHAALCASSHCTGL